MVKHLAKKLEKRPELVCQSEVSVRHYRSPEDIQVWLEIRDTAFADLSPNVRSWGLPDFEREFLSKWWWKPERMWFAEVDRDVMGTVSIAMRGDAENAKPVIHWLAVVPKHRRKGIGLMLMKFAEQACWDAGHRQIWLETHCGWTESNHFYRSLGYGADR